MKYEMKSMGRILLPLYAVLVAAAAVFAINLKLTMNKGVSSILEKFAIFTSVFFVIIVAAVFVVTIFLILQRFYRNLLGNEGYLMFSLPATTAQQIISKALTAVIWVLAGLFFGVFSGLVCVSILSSVPEFLKELKNAWDIITSDGQVVQNMILLLLTAAFGVFGSILKVYAAMSIGHQWNGHRLLGSILAYGGFGIVELILSGFAMKLFGEQVRRIQITAGGGISITSGLWYSIIVSLISIVVYGLLSWYFLDRKLNLE